MLPNRRERCDEALRTVFVHQDGPIAHVDIIDMFSPGFAGRGGRRRKKSEKSRSASRPLPHRPGGRCRGLPYVVRGEAGAHAIRNLGRLHVAVGELERAPSHGFCGLRWCRHP
jgi:hypothetical protein